jgi:hypothetical protein
MAFPNIRDCGCNPVQLGNYSAMDIGVKGNIGKLRHGSVAFKLNSKG